MYNHLSHILKIENKKNKSIFPNESLAELISLSLVGEQINSPIPKPY